MEVKHPAEASKPPMDRMSSQSKLFFEDLFHQWDADGSGNISIEEIKNALGKVFPVDAQAIIQELDINKDGNVTIEEFIERMRDLIGDPMDANQLCRSFQQFDPDGLGFVEVDYFRDAMVSLGAPMDDEEFNDLLKYAQITEGKLDYVHFIHAMTNKWVKVSQRNPNKLSPGSKPIERSISDGKAVAGNRKKTDPPERAVSLPADKDPPIPTPVTEAINQTNKVESPSDVVTSQDGKSEVPSNTHEILHDKHGKHESSVPTLPPLCPSPVQKQRESPLPVLQITDIPTG